MSKAQSVISKDIIFIDKFSGQENL